MYTKVRRNLLVWARPQARLHLRHLLAGDPRRLYSAHNRSRPEIRQTEGGLMKPIRGTCFRFACVSSATGAAWRPTVPRIAFAAGERAFRSIREHRRGGRYSANNLRRPHRCGAGILLRPGQNREHDQRRQHFSRRFMQREHVSRQTAGPPRTSNSMRNMLERGDVGGQNAKRPKRRCAGALVASRSSSLLTKRRIRAWPA